MPPNNNSPYEGAFLPARDWRQMWRDPWVYFPILFIGYLADVAQVVQLIPGL